MGKSGSSNQTVTQEFKPPSYTVQPWQDYLSNAQNIASQGLPNYQGQTVAPLTPMQGTGLQMLTDYATQGTPERWAGGQAVVNAATGNARNPYEGVNPYLSQMIDASNAKIADRYRTGTASQNDALYGRSGAYGGSAWADKTRQNEQDLAGALGANTNALLGQNYTQSANLAELGLARQLQAAGVGQGQQALDAAAIQSMVQGGQIPQQQMQALLDANSNLFNQQRQAPFTLSDFLGSALSRASGSGGSTTQTQPAQSGLMGGLGAGLAGLSMFM